MKKPQIICAGVVLIVGFIFILHAQEAATPVQDNSLTPDNVDWSSASDLEVELKAVESLPTIPATAAPQEGTFWSAQHAPGSGSEWPPMPGNIRNVPVWDMGDGIYLLDDMTVNYNQPVKSKTTAKTTGGMEAMVDMNPGDGDTNDDGGDTNVYTPMISFNEDYGTNLWLQITNVAGGTAGLLVSNTVADVMYEIQGKGDLLATKWISEGFFYGSELTNWTPTSAPATNYPNLFLRILSWQSSDESGLPDWWELEYFGTTGIDPYADPDGDGWNNLQEFQNGTDPTAFNTPPAPQGLTVNYNSISNTAAISWQPSPGSVTGYIVERNNNGTVTDFTFSSGTTSFTDTTETQTPDPYNPENGPVSYNPTYQVQAEYTGSQYSAWSAPVKLLSLENAVAFSVVGGNQPGSGYLVVSDLSQNVAALQITRFNTTSHTITNFNISAGSLTNGVYALTDDDTNNYDWWVQTVEGDEPSDATTDSATSTSYQFYDGRAQLKQNLIFVLRAASETSPFKFTETSSNYFYSEGSSTEDGIIYFSYTFASPASYAYAGLYRQVDQSFNTMEPFEENYRYRNFVFDPSFVDDNGALTTGANYNSDDYYEFELQDVIAYWFQPPSTNWTTLPALLATNQTRWLYSEWEDSGFNGDGSDTSITFDWLAGDDYPTYQLAGNARNLFGLQYLSVELAYQTDSGLGTNTGAAGNSVSPTSWNYSPFPVAYIETAQPQFQTVEYDVWDPNSDALPGSPAFSPTNQSRLMIASVGGSMTNAGYAKLAITNGYSGAYGYLAQYFDKAYTLDTNGVATTNSAGFISPYGDFFPTQAGAVALVTMPDLDTGQRGTNIVYAIKLQLDANHDGNMDLSFGGPDNTSQGSPMTAWVNDGYIMPGAGGNLDQDVDTLNNYPPDYSVGRITCQRDLENFFRLWVCGMPSLPSSQGYYVTLSCTAISGSPAINLYYAETNGGTLYLTDTNTAQSLVNKGTLGTISSSSPFVFAPDFFDGTNKCLMFEGAGIGEGQFTLTIYQGSNMIAQTSTCIDLHDIKDFYERAVITNNMSGAISNWSSTVETVQQSTSSVLGVDTNIIVFVHGINVDNWDWLDDSDTVLKRLYWAGYQGKFTTIDWPCNLINYMTFLTFDVDDFNESEIKAYKAGTALKNYLSGLHTQFPNNRLNLFVHSQGNAVVSEAVEQGAPFDTYILTQGALPANCYDANATNDPALLAAEYVYPTPELRPMGYHGIYTNLTGNIVNFYNSQDKVLGYWYDAQEYFKPSSDYSFDGTYSWFTNSFFSYMVTDSQESRANVSRSRTSSIGAQSIESGESKQGVISSTVDLNAQFGFNGSTTAEHSAQWTRPIQTSYLYYKEILLQIQPAP